MRLLLLVAPLLASSVATQNYLYSPASAPARGGNSARAIPFGWDTARYQQIHGDLRGRPYRIDEIAFRPPVALAQPLATARSIDCELAVGHGDFAAMSAVFAANFVISPVTSIARRWLSLPDITQPNTNPSAFPVTLPFDQPWVFTGQLDLLFELVVHRNSMAGLYLLDGLDDSRVGATAFAGRGCTVAGRDAPMKQSVYARAIGWNRTLEARWWFENGPRLQPAVVFFGPTAVTTAVPGLCSFHYLGEPTLSIAGTTDGSGLFRSPQLVVPYRPEWQDTQLFSQGMALDAAQPGVPLAVTDRHAVWIPALPVVAAAGQSLFASSPTEQAGMLDHVHALVTRFRY